jgi:hypothetical protein
MTRGAPKGNVPWNKELKGGKRATPSIERKNPRADASSERWKKRGDYYGITKLSPGLKTMLNDFENAVRDEAECPFRFGPGDFEVQQDKATKKMQRAKRALVRKLRRLEGTLPPDSRGRKKADGIVRSSQIFLGVGND